MFISINRTFFVIITITILINLSSCEEKCTTVENHSAFCYDYESMPIGSDYPFKLRIKEVVPYTKNGDDLIIIKNYETSIRSINPFYIVVDEKKYPIRKHIENLDLGSCQENILYFGDSVLDNQRSTIKLIDYDNNRGVETLIHEIEYINPSLNDTINYELGD